MTTTLRIQTRNTTQFLIRLGTLTLAGFRPKPRTGRIINFKNGRTYLEVQMVRGKRLTDTSIQTLYREVRRRTAAKTTVRRLRKVA